MKIKITDRKIIQSALSFSLFCLAYFLFFTPEHPANELSVVAKFTKVNKDVRRKMINSLEWETVSDNEEIFANDLLYTGTKSSADIVYLTKDIKLKMPESTILKIEVEDNKPSFEVEEGSLEIESGEHIQFQIKKNGKKETVRSEKATKVKIAEKGDVTYSTPTKNEQSNNLDKNASTRSKLDKTLQDEQNTDVDEGAQDENGPAANTSTGPNEAPPEKKRDQKFAFYFLIFASFILFVSSFFG
jgi:hypothetical protein